MDIKKIKVGKNPPQDVFVVIEVPMNSDPIKYEFDKEVGAIFVDRFIGTNMRYPFNYGFIPNTLSGDGDPADVLVMSHFPIMPGAVINVRPIGVMMTEDEKGKDEKILAVPNDKIDPSFKNIKSYQDLPDTTIKQVTHFFEHYKDLEAGKWVKILGWQDVDFAQKVILEAIERAKN